MPMDRDTAPYFAFDHLANLLTGKVGRARRGGHWLGTADPPTDA